jgi:hypothetical protein
VILLVAVATLLAHHSYTAEYDVNARVTLTGRVTKIEWTNPHVHVYLDVVDGAGRVSWNIEMGSPNGLAGKGWTRKSMKVGDAVTVDGSRAKDGSNAANARSILLQSGVRLSAASSQSNTS